KSDIQIIESLGSPKSIVRDLVDEMNSSKINSSNKRFDKIYDNLNKVKLKFRDRYQKSKEIINNKLTPNLKNDEEGLSTKLIKILLTVLSAGLIFIGVLFVLFMIFIGIGIIASNIAFVTLIITSGPLFALDKSITLLIIFTIITILGFDILGIQVYIYLLKSGKKLYKRYINWLKNKKIYINAKERKVNYKGDDIDE
ncbi:MAG: hypothetical protein ACLVIU_12625, partial [Paraclostridium sp.]